MPTKIRNFQNVRTRLYRHASGVWLAGWMKRLTPDDARVQLKAFVLLQAGERLSGECYGDGSLVRFEGCIVGQRGQDTALRIVSSLTYAPSTEAIRIQVEALEILLFDEARQFRMFVMDASPQSLGGLVDGPLLPQDELALSAATPDGEIGARVRVVNCKADDAQAGHFRVGLKIVEMRRLDAARWSRRLEEWVES